MVRRVNRIPARDRIRSRTGFDRLQGLFQNRPIAEGYIAKRGNDSARPS